MPEHPDRRECCSVQGSFFRFLCGTGILKDAFHSDPPHKGEIPENLSAESFVLFPCARVKDFFPATPECCSQHHDMSLRYWLSGSDEGPEADGFPSEIFRLLKQSERLRKYPDYVLQRNSLSGSDSFPEPFLHCEKWKQGRSYFHCRGEFPLYRCGNDCFLHLSQKGILL